MNKFSLKYYPNWTVPSAMFLILYKPGTVIINNNNKVLVTNFVFLIEEEESGDSGKLAFGVSEWSFYRCFCFYFFTYRNLFHKIAYTVDLYRFIVQFLSVNCA